VKIVLANRDYGPATDGWGAHMTDEGQQLQEGLAYAGWILTGAGYGDGCTDVPTLLERYKPTHVFVQDPRDWDTKSAGCFNRKVCFQRAESLAERHDIKKFLPLKDAGSVVNYQRDFAKRIGADGLVLYYHERSVGLLSPWCRHYRTTRTYHTVGQCPPLNLGERKRGLVSGAIGEVYPLRRTAFHHAGALGINALPHPGYGNRGCCTDAYLALLNGYRVHVATASRYGFALRKIIESVAMGCIPVTDLPHYDQLPVIDEALVRVPPNCSIGTLKAAIDLAESIWSPGRAEALAKKAREYYDWRAMGNRLSGELQWQ
jgi:hypothetical protein